MLKPQPETGNGELRMIGLVNVVREFETSYRILPEFWGKGYMTEALRMFVDLIWSLDRELFSLPFYLYDLVVGTREEIGGQR